MNERVDINYKRHFDLNSEIFIERQYLKNTPHWFYQLVEQVRQNLELHLQTITVEL